MVPGADEPIELCATRCGAHADGWLDDTPICLECCEVVVEDNLSERLIASDSKARDDFHLRRGLIAA